MRRLSALVAVMLASGVGRLCAQPKPTLTLEFEDGFDGQGLAGPVKATVEGQPKLVDGKFGKALLSGPGTGYVYYPTKGLVLANRGTVEMWVCPVDWDGTEEKFHVFFDVRGEGALYLYKYYQGGLLMLTCPNVAGPYHSAAADIKAWKPGEWHHIAGTWREAKQCVYIDGKLIGTTTPALPSSLGETFRIGDHPWHIERTSSSLVDRVRVYDRALAEGQIAAHYEGRYDEKAPLSADTLDFMYAVDPVVNRVRAVTELVGAVDVDEAALSASFTLGPAGQAASPAEPVRFVNGGAETTFPVQDLKAGSYEVAVTVTAPGLPPIHKAKPLDVPSREWLGNQIGLEDAVLPPWTALEVKKGESPVIRCWGREYVFAGSPLPGQIVSAGKPMLARPLTLNVTAGGKLLEWRQAKAEVRSATATAAEVEGSARADCTGGTATLRTRVRAEYDGLLVVDLGLELPAGAKPDSVSLDIPLRPEVAYYRHRWAPTWEGLTGNLPAGEGVIDSASFIPYAWLGDNDRGLFWFCETSEHWPNHEAKSAFETVRSASEVTMRLNLLGAGQSLPEGWKYQFGLQATPVKPIPKDWRKWRLTPAPRPTVHIVWPTPTKDSMKYYGYPEAADPAVFETRVDDFHKQGISVVPYSCLSFLSGASGEFQWFGSQWGMGGGDAGSSDVAAYGAVFEMVCPKAEGYGDFITWKNEQFMSRFGLDGYYHDNTHPYPCTKENTGCGYRRDGTLIPTYPILGFRSLYRRVYAMVKSQKRPTFTMAHMSGKVTIPILAYDDSYLDGEHFRGRVKDSYLDLLPLDTFRAEFMGRQWGLMPYFLPEFQPPYDQQVEPTRGLAGLLMIHDVAPWAIWCNAQVFTEAFDALDAFGYLDADFLPYFDPTPPATTDLQDVYASAYQLPGRALVIVANLSREDRSGVVKLNGERLGLALDRVSSWPDKTPVKCDGGNVQLDVPKLGYRMLLVGEAP